MGLLGEYARRVAVMRAQASPDGEGGRANKWAKAAEATVFLAPETPAEGRRAEQGFPERAFSALAARGAPIGYGDYLMLEDTGETLRVTSVPADRQAPASSSLPLVQFFAERCDLP